MSVGSLFLGMLGHLPLLAVLVVGFILISSRRAWLGQRSALLARMGLGALALGSLLQLAWSLLIPTLYSSMDFPMLRFSMVFSLISLVTSAASAAGVGLLVAAVVTRSPGPDYAGQQPTGGPPFAGPPFPDGQPYQDGQPAGPRYPG